MMSIHPPTKELFKSMQYNLETIQKIIINDTTTNIYSGITRPSLENRVPFLVRTLDGINAIYMNDNAAFMYSTLTRKSVQINILSQSRNIEICDKDKTPIPLQVISESAETITSKYVRPDQLYPQINDGTMVPSLAEPGKIEFNSNGLLNNYTTIDSSFKLTLFQFTDSDMMEFIGDDTNLNVNMVNLNCSNLILHNPESITHEMLQNFYSRYDFMARGKSNTARKSKKKYKKKYNKTTNKTLKKKKKKRKITKKKK
jgi:hypothetical protein